MIGFISCSSSKRSRPALVSKAIVSAAARTEGAIDSSVRLTEVYIDSTVNTTVDTLIQIQIEEEDKLVAQKRLGQFKDADQSVALHYDLRKPNFVIIHHTSQHSVAQTVRTFQLPHTQVSAHYVIGKNGQIIQMLNDYDRAWHAGKSKWGSVTDLNSVSIGIELDNNGKEPFPEDQMTSLLTLLDTLKSKYSIPQLNFIGHGDVAPTRKNDPSVFFPWKKLAERGFGIWYNEDYLATPPPSFNPIDALKIIGYDTSNLSATIQAFKRKYIIKEVNSSLTDYDKSVLYDLYKKYY